MTLYYRTKMMQQHEEVVKQHRDRIAALEADLKKAQSELAATERRRQDEQGLRDELRFTARYSSDRKIHWHLILSFVRIQQAASEAAQAERDKSTAEIENLKEETSLLRQAVADTTIRYQLDMERRLTELKTEQSCTSIGWKFRTAEMDDKYP